MSLTRSLHSVPLPLASDSAASPESKLPRKRCLHDSFHTGMYTEPLHNAIPVSPRKVPRFSNNSHSEVLPPAWKCPSTNEVDGISVVSETAQSIAIALPVEEKPYKLVNHQTKAMASGHHLPHSSASSQEVWYPSVPHQQQSGGCIAFEKVRAEIVEILSPISDTITPFPQPATPLANTPHRAGYLSTAASVQYSRWPVTDVCNSDTAHLKQPLPTPPPPLLQLDGISRIRDEPFSVPSTATRELPVTPVTPTTCDRGTLSSGSQPYSARSPRRARRRGGTGSSPSTVCHLCGKTYTESSNLSKHVRTVHLKLRPFRCHVCSSSFAERNKLAKHIQSVHEHARPYKCDLCSSTFSQASDRKRHRLVLHEGCRPFVCNSCGKAFGRRSSLTQHCQRVHKALAAVEGAAAEPLDQIQRQSTKDISVSAKYVDGGAWIDGVDILQSARRDFSSHGTHQKKGAAYPLVPPLTASLPASIVPPLAPCLVLPASTGGLSVNSATHI